MVVASASGNLVGGVVFVFFFCADEYFDFVVY